jgi:hypothetical protein
LTSRAFVSKIGLATAPPRDLEQESKEVNNMFRIFHAMLAAILGTGASAAPAPNVPSGAKGSTLPVVTYSASALGQPAGGVDEATDHTVKLNKNELKVNKATKNWSWKVTKVEGKTVKVKFFPKVGAEHKENINR